MGDDSVGVKRKMLNKKPTLILLLLLIYIAVPEPIASAQGSSNKNSVPPLILQMAGTWDVRQRMWPASDAEAINLPSAVAQRRLIGNSFIEEVMQLAAGSKEEPFTRIAYFNYNPINQQYEYFSIDTRAPQMMSEKSFERGIQSKIPDPGIVNMFGESFVAPRWGEFTNAPFRYRFEIGPVERNHQVARLYLTPQLAGGAREFLAFEYEYTRRP
jgi:Protein of unknown function (DUF1579)